MRLCKSIIRRLLASPFRVRIHDDQKSWRSYELYLAALHLARAIERRSQKDHVGLMLPTSGLFPAALLATWLLGRTAVPLNYLLKPEEVEYIIDDADLDLVITVTPMIEHFGELPDRVKQLRIDSLSFGGVPPVRRIASRPEQFLAALLYTSGTSGRPKGVMLTEANLRANIGQCVKAVGFRRNDTLLGVLPQFHSFGLTVLTLLPLSAGCRMVYTARFGPRKLLTLLRKHKPTAFVGIPSMYNAMLNAKSAKAEDFSSVRLCVSGAEPLPESVSQGFHERFGITIHEGYGLTETSPVSNISLPGNHKRRSVGLALPGIVEKIIGPGGRELESGQDGEICIKGPNVMKGYYRLPKETAEVFDDEGFFRTGDMGHLDADGHLFITGRIKEMLIIGGENVFPREIEEVLNLHPSVHESAVIGMPDPSRGEVPVAFVELVEDATFNETELRTWTREHLAQFKVPREIRVLEQLPRNPTGKIMRRELKVQLPSVA